MSDRLDSLMARLHAQSLDQALGGVAAGVVDRIDAARPRPAAETWGLRAAVICLVAATSLMVGATGAATAATDGSPFAAWSGLAPSTLLGTER